LYDIASALAPSFRRRAGDLLGLTPGDVVLDLGCGTGLCFPLIQERIGVAGRLVGVDVSAAMMHKARERVDRGGWANVTLLEASVEDADLAVDADAALLCLAHDVLQSEAALDAICAHVAGGRIAVLGGKWAPALFVGLNALVWAVHRPYVRNFEGFGCPWHLLERRVEDLHVQPVLFGTAFLAWGTVRKPAPVRVHWTSRDATALARTASLEPVGSSR
jgi:demethylmenaquinone methyltransferase/2-methoxy-6-polyprenyl-1,4-benzoquinol methylase